MIQTLEMALGMGDARRKATVAKSVKYTGGKQNVAQIKRLAENLIKLKGEADPEVKKNALEGLITIVHSNHALVKDLVDPMQEFAHAEVPIRKELIEEVDIGPFTQKYDKGVPIRRAAFQLLQTIFDSGNTQISLRLVEAIVQYGLADTAEEVVVLCLQILARLTEKATFNVLTKLDKLIELFDKKLQQNYKLVTSQQSQERALNMIRSILRVVYLLEKSDELVENPNAHFSEFLNRQLTN